MSAAVQLAAIVMIAIVGAYVGYHAWQDWLHHSDEKSDYHQLDIIPITLSGESAQIDLYSNKLPMTT